MQVPRARYLAIETAISMMINGAISLGFAWLVFHASEKVLTSGLVHDAAPQTFMVTLMGALVPSLITRKRMRSRHLDALVHVHSPGSTRSTGSIVLTSLVLAVIVAGVGLGVSAAVLPRVFPNGLLFHRVLVLKTAYGALIAAIVTPVAITWALRAASNRVPQGALK